MRFVMKSLYVVLLFFSMSFSSIQAITYQNEVLQPGVDDSMLAPLPPISTLGGLPVKIEIATTSEDELTPQAAYCGHDQYLVVYTMLGNIYGQRVGIGGDLVGAAFQINTADAYSGFASQPDVACESANSRYIVVWRYLFGGSGIDHDIRAQAVKDQHDNSGSQFFGTTQNVAFTEETENNPAIACNRIDAICQVVYEKFADPIQEIYGALIFPAEGDIHVNPSYDDFPIGTTATADLNPDVAWSSSGFFLVTWQYLRTALDPDSYGIVHLSLYDHDMTGGQIYSGPYNLIVPATLPNDQTDPSVAYNPLTDTFLVVFTYAASTINHEITGRYVNGDGTSQIGSYINFAFSMGDEYAPSIAWSGGPVASPSGAGADQFLITYIHHVTDEYFTLMGQRAAGEYSPPYVIGQALPFYDVVDGDGTNLNLPTTTGNFDSGRYFTAAQYYIGSFVDDSDVIGFFMSPYYAFAPMIKKP